MSSTFTPRLIHEKNGVLWPLSLLKVLSDQIKDTFAPHMQCSWICAEQFVFHLLIVVVWLRECPSDSLGLLVGLIIDLQFILGAFVQQSSCVSSLAYCQAEGGESSLNENNSKVSDWRGRAKRGNCWGRNQMPHALINPITLTCSVCEPPPQFQWWSTPPHLDKRPDPCLPRMAWRPLNVD